MVREVFFTHSANGIGMLEAMINFDDSTFGISSDKITPWTISIHSDDNDLGRIVGFEGEGQMIIGMHRLKPDMTARRGCEMTVFRMGNELVMSGLDAAVLSAFERWLLKRGWRGNLIKKMKFTDANLVIPIRTFWVNQGFELVLGEEGKWDEHAVKRWR